MPQAADAHKRRSSRVHGVVAGSTGGRWLFVRHPDIGGCHCSRDCEVLLDVELWLGGAQLTFGVDESATRGGA